MYWDNDQLVIPASNFFLQCIYWNQGYPDNENQSDGRTGTIDSNIFKSSQSNVLFTNPAHEMSSTKQFIVWVTDFSKHTVITFLDVNYRCKRTQHDQLPSTWPAPCQLDILISNKNKLCNRITEVTATPKNYKYNSQWIIILLYFYMLCCHIKLAYHTESKPKVRHCHIRSLTWKWGYQDTRYGLWLVNCELGYSNARESSKMKFSEKNSDLPPCLPSLLVSQSSPFFLLSFFSV